jgi:hypothetical protein
MAPSDSVINRDLTAPQNHSRQGQNWSSRFVIHKLHTPYTLIVRVWI